MIARAFPVSLNLKGNHKLPVVLAAENGHEDVMHKLLDLVQIQYFARRTSLGMERGRRSTPVQKKLLEIAEERENYVRPAAVDSLNETKSHFGFSITTCFILSIRL